MILFGINSVLILKKEFDSEPVSNKSFLKTKLKSHGDEVADFYDKKIPELDSNHTCLEVTSLDSVLKKDDIRNILRVCLFFFVFCSFFFIFQARKVTSWNITEI